MLYNELQLAWDTVLGCYALWLQTMAIMRTVGRIFNRSHINLQPTITAKHNTARVAVSDAYVLLEKLDSDSVTLYRLLHIKNIFFPTVVVKWNMFSFKQRYAKDIIRAVLSLCGLKLSV